MRKLRFAALFPLAAILLLLPSASSAQVAVGISVRVGPPALPVYEQPICPGPGYLWTPGYWAYGDAGYYWVPGTWVLAPAPGLLWTPGYWGWGDGVYVWHAGYWGPHVGFYGGINYGFGYTGVGFVGGRWEHGVFAYNTAVMHVDRTVIHNTYVNKTVINNVTVNHVSYNGGAGGISARPTSGELAAEHERHTPATNLQKEHEHSASTNHAFRASENHGRPSVAATARPGEFNGRGVAAAHNAQFKGADRPNSVSNAHMDRPNSMSNVHADRTPSGRGGNSGFSASHGNNGSHAPGNAPHFEGNSSKGNPHMENRPAKPEGKPHEGGGKPHDR